MADKNDNCCGKTVTQTCTKVTEYGTAACHVPQGTLSYIGARYVPVFADPVEWSKNRPYEHLTMVQNRGNTYISKQAVPIGIDLPIATGSNDYWVLMSNWNAQIEQYREEVLAFDNRITSNAEAITAEQSARISADSTERAARISADDALDARVTALETEKADNTKKAILIGDSYLRTYADNIGWGGYFAQFTGLECASYKSGGAGWVRPGDNDTEAGLNFVQMLEKAKNDRSANERAEIDYIVCNGIINDLRTSQTQDDIASNIRTFCANARTYFPNAKIVIAFAMCSKSQLGNPIYYRIKNIIQRTPRSGETYGYNSNLWFQQLTEQYGRGDDVHPNDNGYLFLARQLAQLALTGDMAMSAPYDNYISNLADYLNEQIDLSSWATVNYGFVKKTNSGYEFELSYTLTAVPENITVNTTRFHLPIITYPNTAGTRIANAFLSVGQTPIQFNPQGAQITTYNAAYESNVGFLALPRYFKLDGTGVATYKIGDRVEYHGFIPF